MVDLPKSVEELLDDEELQNIEARAGWAFGNVVLIGIDGSEEDRQEGVLIELFNGEGRGGQFGGVKFMHEDAAGEFMENYAFATKEAFESSSQDTGWYVEEWTDPQDVDYGMPAP